MSGGIKRIIFDRHARRRMKWRKISEEEIRTVLHSPEKFELSIHGRKNVYRHLGKRYLKVTYREYGNEILIITAVDKNR